MCIMYTVYRTFECTMFNVVELLLTELFFILYSVHFDFKQYMHIVYVQYMLYWTFFYMCWCIKNRGHNSKLRQYEYYKNARPHFGNPIHKCFLNTVQCYNYCVDSYYRVDDQKYCLLINVFFVTPYILNM